MRGVAFDSKDRLWFASAQGVGCEADEWHLYTGADGLPYNDFTTLAAGENGTVWFGTRMGAIRYDGKDWEYRQGRRWLPHDEVRSIAVNGNGDAWFATAAGVGVIERRPMTLAEKAKFFEDEIDKRHRRTPYGYISYVYLKHPGDTSEWEPHDSDNDGLWTAMYGAGECFAYAATKDPLAKQRAKAAFEALRFLRVVTQGGAASGAPRVLSPAPSCPPAVLTRTGRTAPSGMNESAPPRTPCGRSSRPAGPFPPTASGTGKPTPARTNWMGTSFSTGSTTTWSRTRKKNAHRVREHVAAVAGHLIDHNFQLVDHDGQPTRWGIFNPENLNHNFNWRAERGGNSLSILAYLKVAAHITGDPRFAAAARWLIQQHAYAANILIPKADTGPGSGNQSDDEMIFMNYYNLIRYETDPVLRETYALALYRQWQWERPELNPFFDFIYAASCHGQTIEDAVRQGGPFPQR